MAHPYTCSATFVAVVLAVVTIKSQGFVLCPTSCSISGHTTRATARTLLGSSCARPLQSSSLRNCGTPTSNSLLVMMAAGEGAGGEEIAADVKVSRKAGKKARAKSRTAGKSNVSGKAEGGGGSAKAGAMAGAEEAPAVSSAVVAQAVMQQTGGSSKGDVEAARKAIKEMEEAEAARKAERQARIDSVMEAKKATEEDPSAGVIPQVVADRMLKRMVPFFLFPAFCGLAVFVAVYVLSHQYDYTVPAYIVAYTTQVPFVLAVVGTTYGIISASWDEDREGSLLGTEEAAKNLGIIMDGLRRSSDAQDVGEMIAAQKREEQYANRYERRRMKQKAKEDDSKQ